VQLLFLPIGVGPIKLGYYGR